MKQIISLNLGQAGVQAGNSCWQLFCLEHFLNANGRIEYPDYVDDYYNKNTLFFQTSTGKHIPRVLMFDLDPDPIDKVRTGLHRQLFHSEFLLSGKNDTYHNFARATSSIGKDFMEMTLDKIRKISQNCEDFQGFMISNSVGGGCGSGLGQLLLERLSQEFSKKTRMNFPIYPYGKLSTSTVEPYNAVLGSNSLLQRSDISVMMDNWAIYQICQRRLDVQKPEWINMNRVIAKVQTLITSWFRSNGEVNGRMSEMVVNMVPFQGFNFMISSYSPFISDWRCFSGYWEEELAKNMFENQNLMAKCDPRHGKYMSCAIMFMGDVSARNINKGIRQLKQNKKIQFVDWCPSGFKVGMSNKLPANLRGGDIARVLRSSVMIGNNTAINDRFSHLAYDFDRMYKKKAFLHWYLEQGIEEEKFQEARQRLAILEKDYQDAVMETQLIEEETKELKKQEEMRQKQKN